MKLAVLGGSFDPIHNGHVAMAEFVLKKGLANRVVVIPAYQSPFKSGSTASPQARLTMANLAFAHNDDVQVDDIEILRQGPSYMVETLHQLHEANPDCTLRLIVGADNVGGFFKWKEPLEILLLAEILVLGRQGNPINIPTEHRESFLLHPEFDMRMSSTEIRVMLADRSSASDFLPPAVAQYIQSNELYL